MENRKRKRETEAPRIKYHVEQLGRSFERILKEDSREEMREVVRKKLDLDKNVRLELVQVREGKLYDLEDDEDFEAFKSAAYAYSSLDVRVSFKGSLTQGAGHAGHMSQPSAAGASVPVSAQLSSPQKQRRRKQKKQVLLLDQSTQDGSLVLSPSVDGDRGVDIDGPLLMPPPADEGTPAPPKKKRKNISNEPQNEGTEGTLSRKRKKVKTQESEVPSPSSAVPAEQDIDQEPPKKKQNKGKGKAVDTSRKESQAPAPAESTTLAVETAASTHVPTVNPKSKKSKEKKPSLSAVDATVTHDALPQDKPPKAKKKAKSVVGHDGHAEVLPHETPISVGATSISAPPPLASRQKPSKIVSAAHHPQPPANSSTSSRVQSALAAFLSKPARTPAEILASYVNSDADEGSEGNDEREPECVVEEAVKVTKVKRKKAEGAGKKQRTATAPKEGKGKDQSKAKSGKSRLSESWVPDDAGDVASAPPPVQQPSLSGPARNSNADTSLVAPTSPPPPPPPAPARIGNKNKPSAPKSTSKSALANPPCPVCLSRPFHLRFQCPVIQSGVDAMQTRIAELREEQGKEDLVGELEGWVRKEKGKAKGKEKATPAANPRNEAGPPTAHPSPGLKTMFSWISGRQDSPLPSWTPILPLESQPSEVTIESRNEGSSEGSASSSSGSEEDGRPNSESNSDSGSGSESNADRPASLDVNLEDVDLDALVRGPAIKVPAIDLAKIVSESDEEERNHAEDDEDEGDVGVLAEEEEEERPKRPKGRKADRSSSPEGVEGDDESDSNGGQDAQQKGEGSRSEPHDIQFMAIDTSTGDKPTDGREDDKGGVGGNVESGVEATEGDGGVELPVGIDPQLNLESGLHHQIPDLKGVSASSRSQSGSREVVNDEEVVEAPNPLNVGYARSASSAPPEDTSLRELEHPDSVSMHAPELRSIPSTPRATIPSRPTTPHSRAAPSTPGTVQRMKGRHGNLPLNVLDDDIGRVQPPTPVSLDLPDITMPMEQVEQEEIAEKPKRGRSRVPSQPKPTARQTRSRSRTAPPASATSTPTDETSSVSQPTLKRRGRPPLSEAIKAERKAIRDAEKAAKAAEKRAKAVEKKATASRKPRNKTGEPEVEPVPSSQDVPPKPQAASPAPVATPPPASQWKTFPPDTVSSAASRSSPAFDQLLSSSQADQNAASDPIEEALNAPAVFEGNGLKSPGTGSVTSMSRRHDEDDVEHIVGSTRVSENMFPPKRQPLFLSGASQMTQSQTIPRFLTHSLDEEATQKPMVDEREQSASDSSSHTESESDENPAEKPVMPRPHLPSKSTFPSLSQLSFDKFRPSFLLPGRVFSQNKEKEQDAPQPHEDSESEDDEDDESSDEEKQSHIPKGRRAGTGVVKRRKSRGLLHA